MIKKVLLTAMIILLLVIAVTVVLQYLGSQLPEEHTVALTTQLPAPADTVWAILTDYSAYSEWRRDVSAVELLPLQDGSPAWREFDKRGQKLTFKASVLEPPKRLVIEIIDKDMPFSGSWEFDLQPVEPGCSLTITEHGRIDHAILRFLMHKVFHLDQTIKAYQRDLKARFEVKASQ